MKIGKAMGLDHIHVDIRKCLGEERLGWLMKLFNVIFRTAKIPYKWRLSTIILLFNIIFKIAKMLRKWRLSRIIPLSRTRVIFKIVIIIEILN